MLQAIRDKAQGWIAWVIVILISIPFALWGIQEYLGLGKEPVVATVAGAEITQRQLDQRVLAQRERLRNVLGESYDPEMFPEAELTQEVLDQLINEYVLRHAADKWNLRIGDEMLKAYIRSQSMFQNAGRFDPQLYETVLRNNGFSRASYEQTVRQDLLIEQLRRSLLESSFSTGRELSEAGRLRQQSREIRYVRIDAAEFLSELEVSDAALQDFYAGNPALYTVPERIKVAYLELDLETIAEQVSVDEQALRSHFELNEYQYRIPEERRVRHILLKVEDGAQQEALARAEALRQRLVAGEDFEALAREVSDDVGSATEGGDLGWVQRGMLAEAFEDAAFSLEQGMVSSPVLTEFGYHLIEVSEVRETQDSDFEDVRAQVESDYRRREAENLYYDFSERMADLAYEHPDSLQPAAEQLGLEIETSDWFSRNNPPEALSSPKVLAAAFSEDVLVQRLNSERIQLTPEHSLVLRVIEHETERLKPFDEVRDEVAEAYRRQQAAKAARAAGEAALEEVRGNVTLAQLAERHGWQLETPDALQRDTAALPAPLIEKSFRLDRPDGDQPTYGGVQLENGDYAVIALHEVEDGAVDELAATARERLGSQLQTQLARGEFQALIGKLRANADVEIIED